DAERKLAHGVAERQRKLLVEILQRIDAEAVDIKFGDEVLIASDEDLTELRPLSEHLLEGREIPHRLHRSTRALLPKEGILAQLVGKEAGAGRRHRGPIGERGGISTGVAPAHGAPRPAEGRRGAEASVFEYVAGVIENNVEDDVDPERMR